MAYEHERHEWRMAVNAMTDMDIAITDNEVRRAKGVCGDPEDAND